MRKMGACQFGRRNYEIKRGVTVVLYTHHLESDSNQKQRNTKQVFFLTWVYVRNIHGLK